MKTKRRRYSVYAVDGDQENLLLIRGLEVINGSYKCKRIDEHTVRIPHSNVVAKKIGWTYYDGDYNKTLGEFLVDRQYE